ncbi:insulinase family protein [bacterium]|nr:insulinase family protein [bacterium]
MMPFITFDNYNHRYSYRYRSCMHRLRYKSRFKSLWVLLIIILLFLPSCISNQTAKLDVHPSQLTYPPIVFTPPKPDRMVLPNGIVLYLMEDHEIPLIKINAIIRTGSIYESEGMTGIAEITGTVMRTGGTKTWNPEELDRKLEYMGASIGTGIGLESGSASLSVLKKDFNEAILIFAEILRYPVFDPEKVEIAKMKMTESIRRQNDEPIEIASREFKRRIYQGDPRGRMPTIEGIVRITRNDLTEFHRAYYFPNNIIMGISGDFEKDAMIDIITRNFGDWEKGSQPIPAMPVPSRIDERALIYAEKPFPQSTILLGHLCCPKNDPDYFPMEVLNFILGSGGFNSRLMKEIRSDRGLAYSVGSFYRGAVDYGVFGAYAMTKPGTTGKVIDLILEEINRVIEEGINTDELDWARDSILNQFIFSFASTSGLVNSYISLEYNGLPDDYLETYKCNISNVSIDDVKRIAQKYLKPQRSTIVVVGNAQGFDKPLDCFGRVEEADLNIY